jgi:1-acyl-sn-glycerol-3-phosphate acyltransferase
MPGWLKYFWYEVAWFTNFVGLSLFWSYRSQGWRNIPARGPVLVIANHQSFFDPVLLGTASRRHFIFVARKTLFRNRAFRALINSYEAVPIDQDGVGKEGIRRILGELEKGRAVVVFPEGERTGDGTMQKLKPGIVLLIKRVQAPIVPVGIAGAYDAWPRTSILPRPAPLFLPAKPGSIAVSVSPPLDPHHYAGMPREKILDELFVELREAEQQAEKLRRK